MLRLARCWTFDRAKLHRGISTATHTPLLVTPSQCASLPPQSTIFIDASWVMPTSPRKVKDEFMAHRIPTARFLDIDDVASHTELGKKLGLKHMMPDAQVFAQACETLGITRDSHVVLYDTHGCFSSPRALFMFRAFSHNRSSVLNGGLPRWLDEGLPVETGLPRPVKTGTSHQVNNTVQSLSAENNMVPYSLPSLNDGVIRNYDQMVTNSSLPQSDAVSELVLDARSRGRYLGTDPEPRPNLPSGHIPRSISLPFTYFIETHKPAAGSPLHSYPPYLSQGYTTLRTPGDLLQELRKVVGADISERVLAGQRGVVTTCGSGMTAAVLWLGLSTIWEAQKRVAPPIALYDESWTGYAARKESKIAKGEE